MGGIGSGVNSGGFREGGGRPKGARNLKSRELIAAAARDDQLMPITFLLDTMRDTTLPMATRLQAANICAPYLHVRLTALRVTGDPHQLDDHQLLGSISQLEAISTAMSEPEPPPPANPAPGAVVRPAEERHQAVPLLRRPGDQPAPAERLRYDPLSKRMVSVLG